MCQNSNASRRHSRSTRHADKMLKYLLLLGLIGAHCHAVNWLRELPAEEQDERTLIAQYVTYINVVQRIHAENVLEMCRKVLLDIVDSLYDDDAEVREQVETLEAEVKAAQDNDSVGEMQDTIAIALDRVMTLDFDESEWRSLYERCRHDLEFFLKRVTAASRVLRAKFSEDGVYRYSDFFRVLDELSKFSLNEVLRQWVLKDLNDQRDMVCSGCGEVILYDYLYYYKDEERDGVMPI